MTDDERMTRLEEILVELHQRNEQRHEEHTRWFSHLAALTVKIEKQIERTDKRIEQNELLLQEMRAERRERGEYQQGYQEGYAQSQREREKEEEEAQEALARDLDQLTRKS